MSYQVIARKWRPQKFADVIGDAWHEVVHGLDRMAPPDHDLGPRWFLGTRLNFAENLLRYRDDRDAGGSAPDRDLAFSHDVTPGSEPDWTEWHDREHIPERLSIPGFLRLRRYVALGAGPRFFYFYETESLDVLQSPAYLERLSKPTPWTTRCMTYVANRPPDGRCASPDTPIATPDGERPIAELREGDLVYSVDGGAIVPVGEIDFEIIGHGSPQKKKASIAADL